MEIITLTQETCRIKFNNDELLIFEKSLLKVDRHFTVNDFDEIILGISKDEAPKLAQIIRRDHKSRATSNLFRNRQPIGSCDSIKYRRSSD